LLEVFLRTCNFWRDGGSSAGVRDHDIERLFAEHSQRLYAFVAYRTGDPSVAEEIVGDTFERVVRTRRRFDRGKGSEQSWIYAIALNLVTDHQRRAGVERRALDGAGPERDEAGDPLTRVADRDELSRALDRLDPEVREVLALRYGADLRLKDIAKLTGRPLSTVHERLQRGLRSLQAQLEVDDEAPSAASRVARSRHGR
jgi:RNA polymerase sigma-70 factor (ECF subfamily)